MLYAIICEEMPGALEHYFGLSTSGLRGGRVWTLLSYSFLHDTRNLLHIVGNLPPFGVSNQLRGQYFFNAEQWFAQYPQQNLAAQPMLNDATLQAQGDERVWHTVLAGPPVQASKDVPRNLAGLRTLALDPMYQLK